MVNEPSGVQFGLNLYVRVRIENASMISHQNCMTRSLITALLQPF